MASRMREDPLIKIHSESSKEHHVGASTSLTTIFERVIKVVPDRLYTSYSLQPSGVHSASTEASLSKNYVSLIAKMSKSLSYM